MFLFRPLFRPRQAIMNNGILSLILAPSMIVFAFRGDVTRNLFIAASKSPLSHVLRPFSRPSHPYASLSHRSSTLIRGGDRHRCSYTTSSSHLAARSSSILLPESFKERHEDATVAILSVLAACRATRYVQPTRGKSVEVVSKKDASPVTVGDFASQALVLQTLHNNFPDDMFIAEEGSDAVRKDEDLLNRIWEATNHASEGLMNRDQTLTAIDFGQGLETHDNIHQISPAISKRRVWCLDPIDGTKGFLRGRVEGGQYCIALALIEKGELVLSVLGCPNLPLSSTPATTTTPYGLWSDEEVRESEKHYPSSPFSALRGCLFVAIRGRGCYEIPLHSIQEMLAPRASNETSTGSTSYVASLPWTRLHVTPNDGAKSSKQLSQATFCLGVERGFSDPNGTILKIASIVHGPDALTGSSNGDGRVQDIKNSLRIDGQAKYGLLARGDAECFLRLPKEGYIDWVWDVAPGCLILEEAGGTMTDVYGQPIDFSQIGGAERRTKLPDHIKGIVGSCGGLFHEALIEANAKVEQI